MQLAYLVIAKGQRRQASWPVIVAGLTTIIVLWALDAIAPSAVFAAIALVGLIVEPDLGRYLVAAGLFLHGVWDFVHLRLNKVVARSHAEWCFVLDIILAAELVFKL